uniref:Uncharacterized protein n=1 Tax=Anguilla anguilla TaxID=7936 RepID=A0A0E9VGJ1_ANGAN
MTGHHPAALLPTVTGGDEKHYLLISDLKELVLSREAIFIHLIF